MRRALVLTCALLLAAMTSGDAGADAIRARVRVVRAIEPGIIEVYVSVPPAEANRAYLVTGLCDRDEVQSSKRPLDGMRSIGPFAPVVWRNLPGCSYAIATVLLGVGDKPIARAKLLTARILCFPCTHDEEP